ncbi:MAG: ABC transporter permease [Rhizomicrobium sp.]
MTRGGTNSPQSRIAVFAKGPWLHALSCTRSPVLVSGVCLLVVLALATPGFTSAPSLLSLIDAASLVGCVAVGMSFITLSGNVMSFALGATTGASAIACAALSGFGLAAAVLGAAAVAIVYNAIQGFLIGFFRANSIIVSIAALALMGGFAEFITGSQTIYADTGTLTILRSKVLGIPLSGLIFLASTIMGQAAQRHTQFGQKVILLGSNPRAAAAAGVRIWLVVTGTYAVAGFFASLAGILIAARYGAGTMEYGAGYDYSAIASVLVGGTAIAGGEGSVARSAIGVLVISIIAVILLLWGFETQFQYFITGLIVLGAVLLQGKLRR